MVTRPPFSGATRVRRCLLPLFWLWLLPQVALAQTLTGTLVGTVRDAQGAAVPGAVVRVGSPALMGGPQTSDTNEKGQFRFPALAPGTYTVDISRSGFAPHSARVQVFAGDSLDITVVLALAPIAETVNVSASASRLTERQPGFRTRFGPDDLRTIPTRRSSMFDFIRAAPGMSPTSPSSGTVTTVSAFGSGINTNTFLIDGTNFTCPCIGIARSEPGVDFIQEIQVQSVGASAEFGNTQGAVINVLTRQGSDRFLYDASGYWQSAGLTSQPVQLTIPNAGEAESGYERSRYRDYTTSLGGPIQRDRAWFFAGYQHLRDYDSQPGTDPRFPRRYQQDKIVGKLTWRPAPDWQVFHSVNDEFWVNPEQPTIDRPFETTVRPSATVPAITYGHLTHTASARTVWDVRVGQFVYLEKSRPSTGDTTTSPRFDSVTTLRSGAPERFGNITLGRITAKGTISHYRTGLPGGDHEWKVGGQVERGSHDIATIVPTGVRFIDSNGRPSEKVSRAHPSHIGGQFVTAAAFVSDAIAVGDSLTINAGLRFEHNRAISQDLRAIDAEGRETSEIFRGLGTLYTWNVLSPRLGLTQRVGASGRTILRGTYGRFYQGVLTAELDQIHPGFAASTTTNLETGAVRVEDPRVNLRLDPDTRPPYTDEFSIGADRDLGGGVTAAIAYVRKRGHDAIGWSDVAGKYVNDTRPLANGMQLPVFALDLAVTKPEDRRFLLTNQADYTVAYDGLVVALEKRRSRGWQAFGSYTFSRTRGLQPSSGTTAAGEQASTIGPGRTFGRDPNDLTNATGRLPNDRPHALRAMVSASVPRTGLLVAASLQHFSGKPWAATAVVSLPQSRQQRILIEPRGTRRLSSQTLLDLRVSRTILSSGPRRVELLVDILNALGETAEEGISTDVLTTASVAHVPQFAMPNVFVDPRRVMIGVRINLGRP